MKVFEWKRPGSLAAFGAALRRAREEAALTMDDVARRTGISKPYISNIETASAPGPASEEKLEKLARVLALPVEEVVAGADWLRTPVSVRRALVEAEGKTENRKSKSESGGVAGDVEDVPRRGDGSINLDMLMGSENRKSERAAGDGIGGSGAGEARPPRGNIGGTPMPLGGVPLRNVPVINRVAAGSAKEFTDLSYPAGVADGYVAVPDLPESPVSAAFAVRVSGDSMMPEYREGEILIVGPGEARDGDDCVVRLGELEQFATTFKRVFFERDGEEVTGMRLVPLNPAHVERRVKVEEVTGVYPLMYRLVPGRVAQGRPLKGSGVRASKKLLGE